MTQQGEEEVALHKIFKLFPVLNHAAQSDVHSKYLTYSNEP